MIFKSLEEREARFKEAKSARDCEACGGEVGCSDCGELNGLTRKSVEKIWLNDEQVYIDPTVKGSLV